MAMVNSGPISLGGNATTSGLNQSVNIELGRSATASINMNESAVRTLAGVPSGAISMNNFYGKANEFSFTISSNQINANLRSLAISAGWNQNTALIATIASGIYVYSNSTGTPGLTINGAYPGGVTLINDGFINGMGGNGSQGGNGDTTPSPPAGPGGLALSVASPVTINNTNGTIAGGGGGAGGGGAISDFFGGTKSTPGTLLGWAGGGGGGGRTGLTNSSGGPAGISTVIPGFAQSRASSPGAAGTVSGGGSGGVGSRAPNFAYGGGDGGVGGGWGSAGATGNPVAWPFSATFKTPGGPGGSAGPAVSGNSNITWNGFGTRLGGIS
jgi:hypothetical protein